MFVTTLLPNHPVHVPPASIPIMGSIPPNISYISSYTLPPYISSIIPPITSTHSYAPTHHSFRNRAVIYISKMWLLPFDSPAPAYHLHNLLESFIIILTFESSFLLSPSIIHTCVTLKYYCCTINIYLPLLRLTINVTNFNILSSSHIHQLHKITLPSVLVSRQIM